MNIRNVCLPASAGLGALLLLLTVAPVTWAEEGELRTFTSTEGQSLEAKLISADEKEVTIVRNDGKEFVLPIARLIEADRAYIEEWKKAKGTMLDAGPAPVDSDVSLEAINEAVGHAFFADGNLWADDPAEAAERLAWPRESKTNHQSSYRHYAKEDYRFLGARPYSAALYGEGGEVSSVSIVFANKGDYFGAAGAAEMHFEKDPSGKATFAGFQKNMAHDVEQITGALTSILGEAEKQNFGEGESRRRVLRWDWSGHAFLLAEVEDEFVTLAVEKTEFADKRGKVKRTSDAFIRERARANVERRENGDVVITNLPMVDQGPKGYCVPATAERCLRYLGIPADMYLLAMTGQTGLGGGTSVNVLLGQMDSDIKRKGRSMDQFDEDEVKIRTVSKYIDDGIPVMWTLYSTTAFNEIANTRTKERREVTDWAGWAAKVQAAASEAALVPERDKGHVVLITGYNKETGEIAFSDSWGERYLERWITAEEAGQVSQGSFYVIKL